MPVERQQQYFHGFSGHAPPNYLRARCENAAFPLSAGAPAVALPLSAGAHAATRAQAAAEQGAFP